MRQNCFFKNDRIIGKCGWISVFWKITVHFTRQTRFGWILVNFTKFFRIFWKSTGSTTSEFFAPHEFSNTGPVLESLPSTLSITPLFSRHQAHYIASAAAPPLAPGARWPVPACAPLRRWLGPASAAFGLGWGWPDGLPHSCGPPSIAGCERCGLEPESGPILFIDLSFFLKLIETSEKYKINFL
jgi:hypothetical protein